jgi:transmembrane sensor
MQSGIVPDEEALEEAAAWIARLHADDRTADDDTRFCEWISAKPEHAVAFEIMDRGWTALRGVTPRIPQPARHVSRRQLVMAGLGGSLVLGTSFLALRPAAAQTYETGIGEQKHVTLKDGSRIFLNASTKLAVSMDDSERTVNFSYGRASFDITVGDKRPFVVSAGERRIISHGSSFNVGRDRGDLQIVLIQGKADIRNIDAAPSFSKTLHAGERLVSNGNSIRVDRPRLAPLVAWQERTAIFDNDLLSDAAREMNLYSPVKLEIGDAHTANLHVSGIYRVGDNDAFARSIAKFLPVQVNRQGDQLILRSSASNG